MVVITTFRNKSVFLCLFGNLTTYTLNCPSIL
jgi:hypothetical protein